MNTVRKRLAASLLLAPAIYLPLLWVMVLSSSPILASIGIWTLAAAGAVVSLTSAYLITMFAAMISDHQ